MNDVSPLQKKIVRSLLHFLVRLLTHVDVKGVENIPAEGAAILSPNHLSFVDAPLILTLLKREDATSLVADKHQKHLLIRWLVDGIGGIWIHREDADLQAMRAARDYLKQGGLLGVAPEGTRSRTGVLSQAKTGAAYLADKVGVPVIPIAVYGTETAFQQLKRLQRPRLYVRFGEPIHLPPLERQERDAALLRNTDEIMCRIAAMLPEKYRGYYSDHPRLKELLVTP